MDVYRAVPKLFIANLFRTTSEKYDYSVKDIF